MSDHDDAGNGGQDGGDGFKPITSQEEFEKALGKRLERERAKFADYDNLKAKATKFDEAEAANQTELEKAQARISELEQRATLAEQTSLRTRIAAEEGVIPEVLTGSTEEEMRAAAKRVIEWRDGGRRTPPAPKGLKSGSGSDDAHQGEKGRAAAALRSMRRSGT